LEIIHCPGHIHSNVDPLSRLPRPPPSSFSPVKPTTKVLRPDNTLAEFQEQAASSARAKRSFVVMSISDCLENASAHAVNTHLQSQQCKPPPTVKPDPPQEAQPPAKNQKSRLGHAQQSDLTLANLRNPTVSDQGGGATALKEMKDACINTSRLRGSYSQRIQERPLV
jgi:hypothetical protein